MNEETWNFSKRERLGILGISMCIALFFLGSFLMEKNAPKETKGFAAFEEQVQQAYDTQNKIDSIAKLKPDQKKTYTKYPKKKFESKKRYESKKPQEVNTTPIAENNPPKIIDYFEFNPNDASFENLVDLGIKEKTAQTILNFRNKGGKFYKKSDLLKVYGLNENTYNKLEPFINIPKPAYKKKVVRELVSIAMNSATQEEWMKLRGIGPTLSERIIKYRNKLGGFANSEQLLEVYNLPDSTFVSIKSQLQINEKPIKTDINASPFDELKSHPYLKKKLAGMIITYRDRNGKFRNWEDFEKYLKITGKELNNIQQYFLMQ